MARTKRKNNNRLMLLIVVLLVLCVVGAGVLMLSLISHSVKDQKVPKVYDTKTITIGNVGDIIIHSPFYRNPDYKTGNGDYDFTDCFKYMKDLYEQPDYMVANLETTFGGKKAGYSGYPLFNSPDSLAASLNEDGVDLMLTANNHIYDTGAAGFKRTAKTLEEKGYDYTGIRVNEDGKKYIVKDIDGIKVGFINYVYETPSGAGKAVNGNRMDSSVADLLNSFKPSDLDPLYDEVKKQVGLMKFEGAEYIVFYPHWGEEYKLEAQAYQKEMAKELCEIGVDAIIGGHPHVVEPIDVLTSKDGNHKTFVAYSLGNQLSNQRRELLSMKTGNTEDGLMLNLTITRSVDGTIGVTGIEAIPTWVSKQGNDSPTYYVVPVDDPKAIAKETKISGIEADAEASKERTHKIIDKGLKKAKEIYGIDK